MTWAHHLLAVASYLLYRQKSDVNLTPCKKETLRTWKFDIDAMLTFVQFLLSSPITLASNFKKNGRKWILMSHPSAATVTFITFAQLLLYPDMSTSIRRGFNRWIPVLNYTWHDFCNSYVLSFSWTPPFSSSSKSHLYHYHHYLFSYTVWRVW